MQRSFLILLDILILFSLQAQPASIQDCLGAIPVCQQIYEENLAPVGNGVIKEFQAIDNCTGGESHSIWYTFTVNNSGQFGFVLTPNNPDQDFDWVLFNITNASCQDLSDDPTLAVSCNAAGGGECHGPTGATGDSEFDHQGMNCNNFPPTLDSGYSPFNNFVDVEAGNTYVLCIINFSFTSSQGYILDFGLSDDIGIFDETLPFLDEVTTSDNCNSQEILVRFSEFIQCATINNSNFQLSGPGGPFSFTLSSENCDANGNYSKDFLLTVSPPIPTGTLMNLELIVNGSTEVLDICDNPSLATNIDFEIPFFNEALDLGPDTAICEGDTIELESDVSGIYTWSTGSNANAIEATEPGIYWLNIITACGLTSDTIEVLELDALPLLNLGNDTILCPSESLWLDVAILGGTYLWQDSSMESTFQVVQSGTYFVTVSNECGESQDDIHVSLVNPISVELSDASLCPGDSVSFDVSSEQATYLWQDGSTNATYIATTSGVYAVTISNSCEVVELFTEVEETATSIPEIHLGEDTILCSDESLLLDLNIPNAEFLWQDGSTNAFFLVNQPGVYSVTVSNECYEAQENIDIRFVDPILAQLSDASLCPGDSVSFDVSSEQATYLWQDGSTNASYTATTSGIYAVTISNSCEVVELFTEVEETATSIPEIHLGEDTILCSDESLLLDLNIPNAEFLWQDGSTNAFFLVNQPGVYSVTVSNECYETQENIDIRFVDPILLQLSDASLCPGDSVSFDVSSEQATYLWQDGSTNASYTVTRSGVYAVTISNSCEVVELFTEVEETATPIPEIHLGEDTILCSDESLLLDLNIPNAEFLWQDGTETESYEVTSPGNYSVTVSNECESRFDSIQIEACNTCNIYIPNVFSPNGDGYNDFFQPYLNCEMKSFNLKVFNRWGANIFESISIENGWNGMFKGQMVNTGIYVYFIQCSILENGKLRNLQLTGDITIVK